ncbi:MAG: hypothetical protein SGJ27_02340 [Candidatus Melainabacteria bacterium]|nr:hypothetical protein [Candidatus Melainabacteria bacterium]
MSENVTKQETITRAQVESAIKSVRDRGWDVNPYTVAEEAKASHGDISKNPEFMQLIINARGGDVTFQPVPEQHSRLTELEAEVRNLQDRLSTSQELAAMPGNDEALNEQMKALLSSESDDQVKHLENELEGAYAQVVSLEEDKTDLTRSVTGLEKINEALNYRMREMEAESAEIKRQLASQSGRPAKTNEEMESINREMALRLEELISNHRANNEHIMLLEATNSQHESLILELEAKLAELQQEADMLALQLQNAFHVGYQKGIADSKGDEGAAPPPGAQTVQQPEGHSELEPLSQEMTGEFSGQPSHLATGDQEVHTPGQYYEMHQQMPNVEIRNQNHPPEPAANEEIVAETPAQGWGSEADQVQNFARTGPYVASTFNPLESLSWRDLETVYSMGVSSIRDFSRNLTEYAITSADAPGPELQKPAVSGPPPIPQPAKPVSRDETLHPNQVRPDIPSFPEQTIQPTEQRIPRSTFPDDTVQPNAGLKPVKKPALFPEFTMEMKAFNPDTDLQPSQEVQHMFDENQLSEFAQPALDAYGHPIGEDAPAETRMFGENDGIIDVVQPEPPKSDGALDFIDELIDLDKLDIFDSLEDLAELGSIDVLNEPIQINFEEMSDNSMESPVVDPAAAPVSDAELRDLIANRISASHEQSDDQTVRTPPAPDGEEDEKGKKPIPGLSRKFVGTKAAQAAPGDAPATANLASSTTNASVLSKHIPPEIRKACMILGVRAEDLTKELVNKEWKRQITSVHPDLEGGDTESSIYLNTAKDTLLRWLEQNGPKLGGKFGPKGGGSSPFTGKNKSDDKS